MGRPTIPSGMLLPWLGPDILSSALLQHSLLCPAARLQQPAPPHSGGHGAPGPSCMWARGFLLRQSYSQFSGWTAFDPPQKAGCSYAISQPFRALRFLVAGVG